MYCRCVICDKIIPNAVSWFTGEVARNDARVPFQDVCSEDTDEDDSDEDY